MRGSAARSSPYHPCKKSGTGMTGRPGHRTTEMNGKSTVSYLVRTPRVPFFMLILIGLEAKNLLAFQGRRGIASVVRWNLRPVIFGVEKRDAQHKFVHHSGRKKAHKHKQFCPVTTWVRGGGSPDRVARGQMHVYVLCVGSKDYKYFGPGTRQGGSVTSVTEIFFCRLRKDYIYRKMCGGYHFQKCYIFFAVLPLIRINC